jgi:hypothetical protein
LTTLVCASFFWWIFDDEEKLKKTKKKKNKERERERERVTAFIVLSLREVFLSVREERERLREIFL